MRLHLRVCASLVPILLFTGCIGIPPEPEPLPPGPPVPKVSREVFEGRIVCGAGLTPGTVNPCLLVTDSENLFDFHVAEGTETLLVGLTWEPTTVLGEEMQILVESKGFNVFGARGHRYGVASGLPDLVMRIDDRDIDDYDWSWSNITGSLALQARVFPARTATPTVTIDQPFEVHVVTYLGAPAPAEADPFARKA